MLFIHQKPAVRSYDRLLDEVLPASSRALSAEESEYCRDLKSKVRIADALVRAVSGAESVQQQNSGIRSLKSTFESKFKDVPKSRSLFSTLPDLMADFNNGSVADHLANTSLGRYVC